MQILNAPQQQAVEYISGPLIVLAGAGTGKTRVITHKIEHLITHCNIKPAHITALTFTNKAAREMNERVSKTLGSKHTRGLTVSTFHNLGLKFIKTEHKSLGFKAGLSIFDQEDSLNLISELSHKSLGELEKEQLQLLLSLISRFKNAGLSPDSALQQVGNPNEEMAARLYFHYQRQLKAYNAVDFDDLILLPLQHLQANPDIKEKWQNKIRYLLVDEYQDTNMSQYELIKTLCYPRGALTVVGDDHQSVYSWRGACSENLTQLKNDFHNVAVIKLEQNYRSTRTILQAANQLISNNRIAFEKNLWSNFHSNEPIRVIVALHDEDEAQRIITHILSHKFQHRTLYSDYAILYRSNHQSRVIEKALREHHIPYHLSGGTSFFARSEIKDIICYLKILVNPDDDAAFIRIANTPKREIGPATLEKLSNYADSRGINLFAASFEMGLEQTLQGKALERLQHFTEWLSLIQDNAMRGDTMAVILDMLKTIQYDTWILETSMNPKAAEKKQKNVQDLLAWIARLLENEQGETKSLTEVVNTLQLMDILDRNEEENKANAVQLMTLHAAKGLEFPHVFITGLEEDILPHKNSIETDGIEEERRLAYVGITRAKQSLTLSLAKQRKKYNEIIDTIPSRFLEELPKEDLRYEGIEKVTTPESRAQHSKIHLNAIRALLDPTSN